MSLLTLRELLETDFFKQSRILAGKRGINNEVSSVNVIDSPFGYEYVNKGTFVITSGYFLLDNPQAQLLLLDNLMEKEISALGIDLCFLKAIPEDMIEKADKYKLPIISLNLYFAQVVNFVNNKIQNKKDLAVQRERKNKFISFWLKSESKEYDELIKKAEELGYQFPREGKICYIALGSKEQDKEIWNLVQQIDAYFDQNYSKKFICLPYEGDIVCLFPKDFEHNNFLEKFFQKIDTLIRGKHYIGIGQTTSFTDFYQSFNEAKLSIKMGQKLFRDNHVFDFKKLGLYRFITKESMNKDSMDFYNDYLTPIIEYESKNKAELINTVQVFLDLGCSWNKTAEKLFLHPNTVRYRIKLVEDLCKLDFKKGEDRFNMVLALKLMPLIGK